MNDGVTLHLNMSLELMGLSIRNVVLICIHSTPMYLLMLITSFVDS